MLIVTECLPDVIGHSYYYAVEEWPFLNADWLLSIMCFLREPFKSYGVQFFFENIAGE